jgi:hypothetical protein
MSQPEPNLEFTNEYRKYLYNNLNKTTKESNQLLLYLIVVIVAYILILFSGNNSISIGVLEINNKQISIIAAPIINGYLLLRISVLSIYRQKLEDKFRNCIKNEFSIDPKNKIHFILSFNLLRGMLIQIKSRSSIIVFAIFLVPLLISSQLLLLIFQIHLVNNLHHIDFQPHYIVAASKLISVILTAALIWFSVNVIISSIKSEFKLAKSNRVKDNTTDSDIKKESQT